MSEREYMLTVKLSFDAFDDVEARLKAYDMVDSMNLPVEAKKKLQEIFDFQAPRKVDLIKYSGVE